MPGMIGAAPSWIGRRMPRLEDGRFLAGRGRFTDDIAVEGALACVFLRSPHAHARILSIEADAARALPGVVAVLTAADYRADGHGGLQHMPNPADANDITRRCFVQPEARVVDLAHWPLADGRARYVGEPVAAIIACDEATALDAAELVAVEYEILPAVVGIAAALAPGAPVLHDGLADNCVVDAAFGDAPGMRAAFARAARIVRHDFVQTRIANAQMEPRAALAWRDAETGQAVLVSGNQGVSLPHRQFATALGLKPEELRVISPDVGGGFGARMALYAEQIVVLWAALRVGRPVRWRGTRSEALLADYQGRDNIMRAAMAFDDTGRILGCEYDQIGNCGAATVSFVTMANAARMLTTVYDIPCVHTRVRCVLTNTVPTAPYRGAGRPEMNHVLERLMDIAADELGQDRIALRRRNLVSRDAMPYRTASDLRYDCGVGRFQLINAIAMYVGAPVGAPIERVELRVHPSGGIDVVLGTQSSGQGHETVFAQVAAAQIGVPIGCIRFVQGDTSRVAMGGGTHSDRSLRLGGALIVQASATLLARARDAAAELLQTAPEALAWRDGAFIADGNSVDLFAVAAALEAGELPGGAARLDVAEQFIGRIPAFPCGAAVAELEIDPQTGTVELCRYSTVDDVGQRINPMIVEGQVHGAIAQGVGQALHEAVRWDGETGQMLSASFMDYGICRADDLPSFALHVTEDPTAGNVLRVKGAGECGILPTTAAVLNAACDALRDFRVRDLPMPATPEVIWRAIQSRGNQPT